MRGVDRVEDWAVENAIGWTLAALTGIRPIRRRMASSGVDVFLAFIVEFTVKSRRHAAANHATRRA
jgi:hypothetical protein